MKLNKKGYMLVEIIVAFALTISIAMYLLNLTIKFKDTNEDVYYSTRYLKDKSLIVRNIMEDLNRGIIRKIEYNNSNEIRFSLYIDGQEEKEESRKLLIYNNDGFGIEYGKTDESGNFDKNDISYYKKTLETSLIIEQTNIHIEADQEGNTFSIIIPIKSLYTDDNYNIILLGKSYGEVYDNPAATCTEYKEYTNYYFLLALTDNTDYQTNLASGSWSSESTALEPPLAINTSLIFSKTNVQDISISHVCLIRTDGDNSPCSSIGTYDEIKNISDFYEKYKNTQNYSEDKSNPTKYEYINSDNQTETNIIYTDTEDNTKKYILHGTWSKTDENKYYIGGVVKLNEIATSDLINASVLPNSLGIKVEEKNIKDDIGNIKSTIINNPFTITINRNISRVYNNNITPIAIKDENGNNIDAIFSPAMFKIKYKACEKSN